MKETAFAKINLALHVRGRRDDGHHELETLFAFVDQGDVLSARPIGQARVNCVGEFAHDVGDPVENLVSRALDALAHPEGLGITLEKNLPVAAGLGGGSADAGAVFRIIERLHGLPENWPDRAAALGADVPACVRSDVVVGRGTGTVLEPIPNDLAAAPVLLVNPRVPLSTGPVFKGWDGRDEGPLPEGSAREIALAGRNSLEPPATALVAPIADVLDRLRETEPLIARMSGSGATCFAIYADEPAREAAAERIAHEHPGWWLLQGKLR